ncbi:unnamed protein product [Microthlaspi erraticum]|uniref:Uncharacterized protein n=1 Tax=Microthlaspi erraticum TaxID=1685480 RepID=A0A6D2KUR8_9BRAS|nr:unnamed protein product [Microthlaspi erraticum]
MNERMRMRIDNKPVSDFLGLIKLNQGELFALPNKVPGFISRLPSPPNTQRASYAGGQIFAIFSVKGLSPANIVRLFFRALTYLPPPVAADHSTDFVRR